MSRMIEMNERDDMNPELIETVKKVYKYAKHAVEMMESSGMMNERDDFPPMGGRTNYRNGNDGSSTSRSNYRGDQMDERDDYYVSRFRR